ncbi:unnamed protein product [Urochloa humidicola]
MAAAALSLRAPAACVPPWSLWLPLPELRRRTRPCAGAPPPRGELPYASTVRLHGHRELPLRPLPELRPHLAGALPPEPEKKARPVNFFQKVESEKNY